LARLDVDSTGFYAASGYRKHGLGRFYAKGVSVQYLSRGLRVLLCRDAVGDLDFERFAPTICLARSLAASDLRRPSSGRSCATEMPG
jgi:hypothetical protein